MISNAAHVAKLNRSQKVVKEGSVKMPAQFRIGNIIFKECNSCKKNHNKDKIKKGTQVYGTYKSLIFYKEETVIFENNNCMNMCKVIT
jgi:hypothetical protein